MIDAMMAVDAVARETMLFAAAGLLIGGIDDLAVDTVFLAHRCHRRGPRRLSLSTLPRPAAPGRIAVVVAAWDEAAVIGAMLTTALARFDHADYRLYVGTYPNDRATVDIVARIAEIDPRVRLVVGSKDGPTTKADCLNTVWRALVADEADDGVAIKAVVLHDAEDVVHPAELRAFDALIEGRAVVQLPILPLVKRGSRLVSGHYADEFAEAICTLSQYISAFGSGLNSSHERLPDNGTDGRVRWEARPLSCRASLFGNAQGYARVGTRRNSKGRFDAFRSTKVVQNHLRVHS